MIETIMHWSQYCNFCPTDSDNSFQSPAKDYSILHPPKSYSNYEGLYIECMQFLQQRRPS